MTSSPDLERQLRAFRPVAPPALRARVREIAASEPTHAAPLRWGRLRLPARRLALVAIPAALALAVASAGVVGLSRSDVSDEALRQESTFAKDAQTPERATPQSAPLQGQGNVPPSPGALPGSAAGRAQRVSATLTLEVDDSDAVSRAAQDALALTDRLGGYVVASSVTTGEEGSASLTVRVPVGNVQEALVGLSALGRIVSQQVAVQDLQEDIDASQRRIRSLTSQLAVVNARLESDTLDAETRASLEARRRNLRTDLLVTRRNLANQRAEARMSTIQLAVVTPGALGAVAPPSRLDRTIDEALNVLAWEGVLALAALIVAAPFALVALAVWLGRRLYRHREEERLLAT